EACPLQKTCVAFASGNPEQFPGKKPVKAIPVRKGFMLVLHKPDGSILLEKRPPSGIWGGLWCLPEYFEELAQITDWCKTQYGLIIKKLIEAPGFRHTFSHFHYDISPIHAEVVKEKLAIKEHKPLLWYDLQHPPKIGLAKPIKYILELAKPEVDIILLKSKD
ncbi:MAG: NUDIX domain-containing protein, partial [Gammaproteobacteria bacterium]